MHRQRSPTHRRFHRRRPHIRLAAAGRHPGTRGVLAVATLVGEPAAAVRAFRPPLCCAKSAPKNTPQPPIQDLGPVLPTASANRHSQSAKHTQQRTSTPLLEQNSSPAAATPIRPAHQSRPPDRPVPDYPGRRGPVTTDDDCFRPQAARSRTCASATYGRSAPVGAGRSQCPPRQDSSARRRSRCAYGDLAWIVRDRRPYARSTRWQRASNVRVTSRRLGCFDRRSVSLAYRGRHACSAERAAGRDHPQPSPHARPHNG